ALLWRRGRPADCYSRDGEYMLWKSEEFRDFGRTVADHADRACAEALCFRGEDEGAERDTGIDRSIEERIEVIVRERNAAPFVPEPLTAIVAAEDQQRGDIFE